MADLLNIGLSGLSAAKTNLSVVGHNITNVNTPGYSRQDTVQATRPPQYSGASGYIGSGTSLMDVRRSYSEFLATQLRSSTALNSDVKAYKSQIDQLDSLLAGSATGISPAFKSFFAAMQTAAEDPANIPARQLLLAESEGLARRFNNVYDSISAQNDFINRQMKVTSEQINSLASSIAGYNDAIARVGAGGHPPNDLLDKRDEAIRELATHIGVTVVAQDGHNMNVFVGSGQPLVVGNRANGLEVVPGSGDPTRFEVLMSGGAGQNITHMISGGEMGGLLRYREEVLDETLNSLGRLALAVGDEINRQLGQGLDLKGNAGAALFNDINSEQQMGLRVRPMSTNANPADGGELRIEDTRLLQASDYLVEYRNGVYSARRLSDDAAMLVDFNADGDLIFKDAAGRDQGFSLKLDAMPPDSGSQYLLQPTRRGAADISSVLDQPDQLAFAAPLRSEADLQNRGTGTIGQPSLEAIGDGSETLNLDLLSRLSAATLEYEEVSASEGKISFQDQTVTVDGVDYEISFQPQELGNIKPGGNNELKYEITISDGTSSQSYTVKQDFSGRPESGDTFTVSFNQHGVSDNRNALKLADLQNRQVIGVDANIKDIATGMSFSDDYGNSVERVGTLTAQARQDEIATDAVLQQAQDNRDSLSGVNLDEEAAKLIQFEQYYNASAQVIQVARSLFDTLLGAFR